MSKTDWRGTPINIGDTVIYGAPVGRSIAMVEGIVDGWTKSGRVNVRITRRAYGYAGKDVVHVGADRLTIVEKLPDSALPTATEAAIISMKNSIKSLKEQRDAVVTGKRPVQHGMDEAWYDKHINDTQGHLFDMERKAAAS